MNFNIVNFNLYIFTCNIAVSHQESQQKAWLWFSRRRRCKGSRVFPAYRLGQDRESRGSASLQAENRKCSTNFFIYHVSKSSNRINNREIYQHSQKHRKDVSNFDKQFTSEKTDLTPTDKLFMMNLDQTEFMGFSFLNPEFVEHI